MRYDLAIIFVIDNEFSIYSWETFMSRSGIEEGTENECNNCFTANAGAFCNDGNWIWIMESEVAG